MSHPPAGSSVDTCAVPAGRLVVADAPVRALCRAYATAHQGGVLLVSRAGEVALRLASGRTLRSLVGPLAHGGRV